MMNLIVLCVVILTASALPTDIGSLAKNGSRFDTFGLQGFGFRTVGGVNGAVWTVWDAFAFRTALNSAEPRVIYVRGRIDLTQLFTGSPGVLLPVGPYKSILGGDSNAEIYGGGIVLNGQVHVIISDLKFTNALSYAPGEQPNGNGGIISQVAGAYSFIDAISVIRSEHVWINHCEFSDDPWNSAATSENQRRHDGLIDITGGANWISVSNNIFRNHNLVTLVGNDDNNAAQDSGRLKVSFWYNWYQRVTQRNPRVRYGEVHVFNNLYTDIISYGMGVGAGAQIYAERNACVNSRRCWGFASGVPNPAGNLVNDNNLLVNSGFDSGIPTSVGFHPSQYYGYSVTAAANVEAHVRAWAGPRFYASSDGLEGRTEDAQFPTASALRQSALIQHCPLKGAPKCPPASKRYRTHDGTCNNLHRPRWGSTLTPVQRFLPPSYSDGLQAPRRSIFGNTLPSAREISALVHESTNVESPGITHLLMQWGQFLDHDVTSSSQSRGFNGSVPRCCKDGGKDFVSKEFMHPECFPIAVPSSDPFYGPRGVRCLDFVRSSPAPRDDCALGWREQLNQVSAYIDGSPLYASSARQSDKLRLFRNGMLQYGRVQQRRPILPPQNRDELCRGGAVSTDCFKSGDARVNEHPGLVAAHIVWLRQHNRMAQELAHLNPHWSDEKIYQETRKIVGAMIQHITYREFLPVVLGSDVMEIFELEPQKKGYYKGYSPKINANPASSFGSAAFRFGHSLVQASMVRYDRFHRPINNNVSLHNELTNPSNIWSMGAVDRLLLGMANQPIQRRDEFITAELTNHLFQTPSTDFGMDLAAINIQRGRDHGVPPYTSWREPCGLSTISGFEDLFKVMPARAVRKLKVLYRHVDDVDLFTGGMAERPVVGGLVGPTFACIIAQQFSNLRKGDRFWYENGGLDSSFTPAQLQQLRRISFAQVMCRTLDTIDNIQPFAFLSSDHPDNDRIACQNALFNNFDLSPWIELDSESNNDIRKSDRVTNKPKKTTTTKPPVTTKMNKISSSNNKRPNQDDAKTMNVTKKLTDSNMTAKDDSDSFNFTLNIANDDKVNKTVQIDDKLDFKNKSKRFDDTDTTHPRNKPSKQYSDYDYEDDEDTQSVQSVVINQTPHKRPYNNYKRPVLTVTENINKYTYLINYVPRPTESYRRTTRRTHDRDRNRDIVKVTYQTYDDTYRRPNKPYYQNRPDYNDNYRNNRPNTRTTVRDLNSSARSNDEIDKTTAKIQPDVTIRKDIISSMHKTDKITDLTTENMYKLVTFGYVGSYRGDMNDKLTQNNDQPTLKSKDEDKQDTVSNFNTKEIQTNTDNKDITNTLKLSTFYTYDTSTKPYNLQRSTRRNDDHEILQLKNKNSNIKNIIRYPDPTLTDKPLKKDILKENYNNPGIPVVEAEERLSLDNMPDLDKPKATVSKLRVKVKKPSKPAQTPSVAFQVNPSEISPSQWAVYEEDSDLSEDLPHRMSPMKAEPHASKEIPRPITLISLRRRRPGLF